MKKFLSIVCILSLILNLVPINVQATTTKEREEIVVGITGDKVEVNNLKGISRAGETTEGTSVWQQVNVGDNFEIYNSSESNIVFTSTSSTDSKLYSCIIYNTLGGIKETRIEKGSNIIIIPGEKVRITAVLNSISIEIPNEIKGNCKFINNPMFEVAKIDGAKKYEFRNESEFNISLIATSPNAGASYDIVNYDGYGKVSSFYKNKPILSTISSDINTKFRIDINTGEEINLYVPYEYKDSIKQVVEPALYTFTIKSGESYELFGDNMEELSYKNTARSGEVMYDIVRYDANNFVNMVGNDQVNSVKLGTNEKARITLVAGEQMDLYLPYEFKDLNNNKNVLPALQELKLKRNENYEFIGVEKEKIPVLTDGQYDATMFDFVEYDIEGNITNIKKNTYGNLKVLENSKCRITTSSGISLTLHLPYEYKDNCIKSDIPTIYELNVDPNKYYEMNNKTDRTIKTINTSSDSTATLYDYIRYSNQEDMAKAGKAQMGMMTLESNEKIKFGVSKNNSMKVYVPYEYKDIISESDTPVFSEYVINTDKKYRIYNNTDGSIVFLNNGATSGSRFNLALVYGDGENTVIKNNTYSDVVVGKGESAVVQLSKGNEIKFYLPYGISTSFYDLEDVNKDSKVDAADLALVSGDYNKTINDKDYTAMTDLNYDGIVDIYDLVIVAGRF